MGITYGELLFCHGNSEGNVDKKISTREYNNRMVYDCFNNPFTADSVSPDFNLIPITVDDILIWYKTARYIQDLLPATISFAP